MFNHKDYLTLDTFSVNVRSFTSSTLHWERRVCFSLFFSFLQRKFHNVTLLSHDFLCGKSKLIDELNFGGGDNNKNKCVSVQISVLNFLYVNVYS